MFPKLHNNLVFCHTSHLTLALVGLLQMIKGFGGVSGIEAAVRTSRASEFALFYNKTFPLCSDALLYSLAGQNFDEN